jgi:hypothetical protein
MAEGFPDRMKPDFKGSIEIMYENKRLGQKNDVGFYKYELDRKGKKAKVVDPTAYELVATVATAEKREFDAQEIIDRMMLAFCNETVRCLEDNIVATASEARTTVVAIASAEVFSPRITSTNGIMCTGLKKCIPTKFSGRCRFSAKRVIEIVEVFEAMIVLSRTFFSVSASTMPFTFGFSVTASITMSTSS